MQRMQKTIPSKPPPSMDIGEAITPPILRVTEERLAGQADLKPTAVKTKPIRRLDFGMKETSARSTTLVARDSSDHTSPSLSSEESQPDSPPSRSVVVCISRAALGKTSVWTWAASH